jgi:FkbM family methyltransferase
MPSLIKRWGRPVALPLLHRWQWFYDYSRGKLREYFEANQTVRDEAVILQDIHGIRFVLYPFDELNRQNLVQRTADVKEFQIIPSLVQSGDTAIDIGANAGLYAVLLSRLCGKNGRVWAFEPAPDTYWRLRETLALNRCENVVPVQSAICEAPGYVKMKLFEQQFAEWNSLAGMSMRAADGTEIFPRQSVDVAANSLDGFCEEEHIDHINFLKVDVEGFELAVFRGAQRLLREHRIDYICFEISKEPLKNAGVNSRKVFEALEMHGYRAYRFDQNLAKFQGPIEDTAAAWENFFATWKNISPLDDAPRSNCPIHETYPAESTT